MYSSDCTISIACAIVNVTAISDATPASPAAAAFASPGFPCALLLSESTCPCSFELVNSTLCIRIVPASSSFSDTLSSPGGICTFACSAIPPRINAGDVFITSRRMSSILPCGIPTVSAISCPFPAIRSIFPEHLNFDCPSCASTEFSVVSPVVPSTNASNFVSSGIG